ncbi:hypothetical protein BABINDRAFT_33895 [Babjeviella inositovora NRRL Y-12698]|uniref:DNA/RNA-binding protein Kin17 WH-like domain-containing protein n=1 Tax=Babjeviella inositovora NRRL Y-12698 TaxID=984486 RepID=A0A1E3QTJ3_9ASCO|nr:uncharacterized protein BABINDRAFT_33895 [Babjeviella inositovora NRRL Y-12698]ODQ80999.1 hypothetical protein BABINDRAFT_33895 [Babjeviella inositovora NRRL Y-12698]
MAKSAVGTPKHLSNKLKAAGLQKLANYCQICSKQCRDANGFKNHILSSTHLNNLKHMDSNQIEKYSQEFMGSFLRLLRLNHGEKRISANKFYQEFIQDKDHTHMNSTKWSSLTQFVAFMGKNGLVRVDTPEEGDDVEPGLFISYVDNSPEAVQRRLLLEQKGKSSQTDEEVSSNLLNQQIKRAAELYKQQVETLDVTPAPTPVGEVKPVKISLKTAEANSTPRVSLGKISVTKPVQKINAFKVLKPVMKNAFK